MVGVMFAWSVRYYCILQFRNLVGGNSLDQTIIFSLILKMKMKNTLRYQYKNSVFYL